MIARYREIVQALSEAGVRYVVVGGWAVVIHGHDIEALEELR
ncbi:MAG: hypothetical protein ACLGH3_03420 [Actinomycetota bacterium]